ncbi:MAG: arginine--tRNA ligase [Planctomycetaceae bacterium]|nr:arginine--tRNA ligase [Planctomycetaceae bacterium]
MNILQTLRDRFALALADFTDDPQTFAAMVRPAQGAKFGDYQANCAMPLAKVHGTNPRELAASIVSKLDLSDLCDAPEVAGPGFINLSLQDDWLWEQSQSLASDLRLGVPATEQPRNIVVDFSSPNVAKPMHVGHLRSTVIGDALSRILRFLGHQVTTDNHIGDWGTQFGMIIYGYKQFLDEQAYADQPVAELARLYRLVNQLSDYHAAIEKLPILEQRVHEQRELLSDAEAVEQPDKGHKKRLKSLRADLAVATESIETTKRNIAAVESDPQLMQLANDHPNIARGARDETAKLHAGDVENTQLWEQFMPQCLNALDAVYDRLGIHFDLTLGESHYQPMLANVVADLKAKGLATESDGAMCVFIAGNDAPFIVQKADGAFNYATTDLATIRYRVEELAADTMLYVVDSRQGEHFKLLFATAEKWGYTPEMQHIKFGTVMGKDRKPYKTRSGDTVGLESLLDEAVAKAYEIAAANDDAKPDGPELDEQTRQEIAEVMGIGGIKYADLHINRESDYVFDWDTMLNMKGDTATYMQYAYARTRGILRRGEIDPEVLRNGEATLQFSHEAERQLALKLCQFPEAVAAAAEESRPNLLTQYLFETAGEFSTFYEHCPVLKEEDESLRLSRCLLVDLTGRVIQQGLELLGIQTCEQM